MTVSSFWLVTVCRALTRPRSGLLFERLVSTISVVANNVSPGRTGRSQLMPSLPGDAIEAASDMNSSTIIRMRTAVVCHPLATIPPNAESRAARGSV